MQLNGTTIATVALTFIGALFAAPVLSKGFKRRGTGMVYESSFVIQRAPQLASIFAFLMIVLSFIGFNGYLKVSGLAAFVLTAAPFLPKPGLETVSWLGVLLYSSGLIFMIGGWYSLGDCFSTDAEMLDGQTVRRSGMLKYVMHPAYSGIIQSLLGAAIACFSLPAMLFTLFVVAPLWLNRAKYEEKLLLKHFGEAYQNYADELKWRRLVPPVFPIGV